VRSNGAGSGGELTPPVPSVDYGKYGKNGPPSPAFSVGSTFLNSASAATQVRPQVVRVASGQKKNASLDSSIEDESSPRNSLLPRDSSAITIIDDTPDIEQGPFKDPPKNLRQSTSSLSAIIEEAQRKATSSRKSSGSKGRTPFGDENEVKD